MFADSRFPVSTSRPPVTAYRPAGAAAGSVAWDPEGAARTGSRPRGRDRRRRDRLSVAGITKLPGGRAVAAAAIGERARCLHRQRPRYRRRVGHAVADLLRDGASRYAVKADRP